VLALLGSGVQPVAARAGTVSYDQLHHFVASGVWDAAPLETVLLNEADRQVGGNNAWLIVDDTALPKKGHHSVGVAPQYASALGKYANCQTPVSLTLASGEVPVMVRLRLFLPESWTSDAARLDRAGVPDDRRVCTTKPEIALAEIDRVRPAASLMSSIWSTGSRPRPAPAGRAVPPIT
jgi:SRSO17 transposase